MSGTITDEFRKDAARYSLLTGEPMEEIAEWLGVRPNTLEKWRRKFESSTEEDADGDEQSPESADEIADLKKNLLADRFDREILQPYAESLGRLEALRIPFGTPSAADIGNLVNAYATSEELASDIGRLTRLVSSFDEKVENIEGMGDGASRSAMFDAVIELTRTGWSMRGAEPVIEVVSQQSSAPWGRFTVQLDIPPQEKEEEREKIKQRFRVLRPVPELINSVVAPALMNEGIIETEGVEEPSSSESNPPETGGVENE